jgi:hypothetical protein
VGGPSSPSSSVYTSRTCTPKTGPSISIDFGRIEERRAR